jgi:tetratricopeptide (TPR) repeat protein
VISDNPMLDEPAAQALRRELVSTAMDYYQKFLAKNADSPALAAEVAATHFRLWQLHVVSGEPDEAQTEMEQGLAVLDRLQQQGAGLADLEPLRGGLFRFPHYVNRKSSGPSNPQRRLELLQRSRDVWQDLADRYPDVAGFSHDLAGLHYYVSGAAGRAGEIEASFREIAKSIEISKRLVERHPENSQYKRELSLYCTECGTKYELKSDVPHELEWLQRAAEVDPTNPDPHAWMAWVFANNPDPKIRNPQKAIALAHKAVDMAPRNANFWNTLGVAQFRAGDFRAAVTSLDESMILREGGDGFDWYYAAMAWWKLGDKPRAEEFYRKAEAWKQNEHLTPGQLNGLDAEAKTLLASPAKSP